MSYVYEQTLAPAASSSGSTRLKLYWMLRRQSFFVQQRVFSALSFFLLDRKMSGGVPAKPLRALETRRETFRQ